ncbi:MAG: hypothetical protein J0I47_09665 [Sphingomonas sp.]|uniref:hypothetical protein n=1 Tax=Sphingomonas sp. TaxID=28214 RepID=UPI001ACCCD78|nr:hypothetical protein [Sphingomonas sp.]MBN8808479.1 hypothetical protein [Sphingomonas sp.]
MSMLAVIALLSVTPTVPAPVDLDPCQQRRGDRSGVFQAMREGRTLPLPEIERRVIPAMRGAQYLGPEFDPDSGIYTLKFLRDGSVIWLKVDGRSGQIIGREGY